MNDVSLVGRLTADPELKTTTTGTPYVKFSLGVDRGLPRDKREERIAENKAIADFPRIAVFGPMAGHICNYLSKGSLVSVSGSVRTDSYDSPEGEKKFFMEIHGRKIRFLEGKKQSTQNDASEAIEIEVHDDIPF